MRNQIQVGASLSLLAPYDVTAGQGFMLGAIFAVASQNALSGEPVEGKRFGVYALAKTSAQAWGIGDRIYWDSANKRCDKTGTIGTLIGVAVADAADPSAVGIIALSGAISPLLEGTQAAIPDIATPNASDLVTAQALANQCKATINTLLAELRIIGVIL
jgi:predicted RecA/RadA family phage recombinase